MKYKIAILKSVKFIESNLKNKLSLKDISKYVGYSEYHFSRIFKSEMKLSVMDYVQERRLLMASKEMLRGEKIVNVSLNYLRHIALFQKLLKRNLVSLQHSI